MAQDYHIYIHSNSGNGSGSKTTPFSAKSEGNESFASAAQKPYSTVKGLASGNGVNMGVSALSKVAPWVAVVIAAAKVTDKVLSTGFAHQEEYTGNYKNNVMYNNFKSQLNALFHPARTGLMVLHQQAQFNKQNKEISQQNKLIGDSILKDFNIGV